MAMTTTIFRATFLCTMVARKAVETEMHSFYSIYYRISRFVLSAFYGTMAFSAELTVTFFVSYLFFRGGGFYWSIIALFYFIVLKHIYYEGEAFKQLFQSEFKLSKLIYYALEDAFR